MKFTVTIFLLVAACHAAEPPPYRGRQKARDTLSTDKRELAEGSGNVDKRESLSTVAPSPTPGIEYADSKESQQDKSPAQQVYATPVPQLSKISDVLTGQGPPFPAAIASHLYSPISVYQPRLSAPTTYELSPPIPSQLAYSEHKIAYQQQPNAIPVATSAPLKVLPNYQPAYQQQILLQPQPLSSLQQLQPQSIAPPQQLQSQPIAPPQQLQPQPLPPPQQLQLQPIPPQQQLLQEIPQNYQQPQFQIIRPIQYIQGLPLTYPGPAPGLYLRNQVQLPYLQPPQLIPVPVQYSQLQPGIVYTQNSNNAPQNPLQKPQQAPVEQQPQQQQIVEKQEPQQQIQKPSVQLRAYSQPQGAVSYASFSQSQPSRLYLPKEPEQTYQPPQPQPPRLTLQFRSQPLNTHIKPEGAENLESSKSLKPISYFRPGATIPFQPIQQQVLPQQPLLIQNQGYGSQPYNASPTFPPVQYFGKNAQRIFPRYSPKS
ncbi:bromodomain-containing protein 4-like [Plodia interpunctella]|uniref:bromodomain-containing protein 4-like n=1 Tax=Plodia interpunctella TaxID=58824 RepID=UPI002367F5E3|nr:bromodomain-containing protein 4-like [Plodia interpunctella]